MIIDGKVHCFFEQSGTFKNEFIKLGIPAEDYDIQNNFDETDHVIDLFAEIEKGYNEKPSIFDNISKDDLIIAFYPCIYFCEKSQYAFYLANHNYRCLTETEKIDKILERENNRHYFYSILLKFIKICFAKNIRMIFENPYTQPHYLTNNFVKNADLIDKNRTLRGDFYKKPTAYFYFNCEPTNGESYQNDKEQKIIIKSKGAGKAGLCSEERSMISPDYARNFICDFILGKTQYDLPQQKLKLF